MKTFSEKVRDARREQGLNQQQLADYVGISKRSIAAYETTETKPRGAIMKRLAQSLKVSVDYLIVDEIQDPNHGFAHSAYLEAAKQRFGRRAVVEMERLLRRNTALFAGGEIDQETKDAFFEAVMKAYLTCKDEARRTYGPKDGGNDD